MTRFRHVSIWSGLCIACGVLLGALIALTTLGRHVREAEAHHDVHFNSYYWEEWAYSPLTTVPARDCGIAQNNALLNAAAEWNASGYVNITSYVDYGNCSQNPYGIRWFPGGSGCSGEVQLLTFEEKDYYLDPDLWTPPTRRATRVNIFIGTGCADGDSTCAGWYSPCDVLTHEMGHALGLADHYRNACLECGPAYYVFSYPNAPVEVNNPPTQVPSGATPTIMDYPHRTDVQPHDRLDLNLLYRRAPFSPWNMAATSPNFHRINLSWTDRSHNELNFYLERSVAGGPFVFMTSTGANIQSTTQDIVAPGQQFCYRGYGRNSWGSSGAYSNTGCTTPPHAVGSQIVGSFPAGSTSVGLCWDPAPGSAGVTGYYVLRRRDNGNGTFTNTLYLEPTTTDCYGNGKVAWLGTVSSTSYRYHWAVKGCDGSWGCSDYKDMTSPGYQWVWLPWTGSGNTGSPTSGYHSH